MRANRKPTNVDWQFDGTTITVRIPMTFVRRGGRKLIITPGGGDAWAPSRPRPDEALRAVVRAHRWKRLLDQGKHLSAEQPAEAEGMTRSFVNRLLRLTCSPPTSSRSSLPGGRPKGLQLEDLTRALPSAWDEQQQRLFAK